MVRELRYFVTTFKKTGLFYSIFPSLYGHRAISSQSNGIQIHNGNFASHFTFIPSRENPSKGTDRRDYFLYLITISGYSYKDFLL